MRTKLVHALALSAGLLLTQCKNEPAQEAIAAANFYETELFRDVQLSHMFADSKTFVDMERNRPFAELEALYLEQRSAPDFDLESFVAEHFKPLPAYHADFQTDPSRTMFDHIGVMWDVLKRDPLPASAGASSLPLSKEYIVPGGRFREIYYWDSYFTMLGLVADGRTDLAGNMLDNFAHLIDSIGFIPNGTRDYYLTRSQPPFFSLMVDLLSGQDPSILQRYFTQLEKEYAYWMEGAGELEPWQATNRVVRLEGDTLMNRYWDSGRTPRPESYREDVELASELPTEAAKEELYANLRAAAASGWDFSSRWYAEEGDFATTQTTELLPVDLNSLLFFMENLLAEGYRGQGLDAKAGELTQRAARRQAVINTTLWSPEAGFYVDYDFNDRVASDEITLAGVFPLYFGMASPGQASAVRQRLMDDFLSPGGLVTTLKASGQQWDAPNGWAPLQWIAVGGLLRYGYTQEARQIMSRWVSLNQKVYRDTGKMLEKYNVRDTTLLSGGGEYPTQDGFGWSNGVAVGFRELLRAPEDAPILPEN